MHIQIRRISSVLLMSGCLVGCSGNWAPKTSETPQAAHYDRQDEVGKLFGEDFLVFGGKSRRGKSVAQHVSVDPFLWQATLDTLDFMPLASADSGGRIIVTDWYRVPKRPCERLKVSVFFKSNRLNTCAIKVIIYKQIKEKGSWKAISVNPSLADQMETIILSKARELKVQAR